jgi:hypothetical protein
MSSTIVRLTHGVAALALLVSAGPALAQNGIAFASLQIQLWPEYDQPKTLVILDGRLDATVTLPAELTLRIPAAAGQPNAVAVRGLKGDLLSASYTTTLSGGDLAITFVIHPAVNDPLPARPRAASAIAEANAPDRYCVQCGRALLAGDQFCRNCGTKARQQSG